MRLGKVRYGNVIVVVVRAGGWPSPLSHGCDGSINRGDDDDDDDDDVDTDIDIDIDIFWRETNGNYL